MDDATCLLIQELNLKFWLGYTMWELAFLVNGKVYAYELNDHEYYSVRGIYRRSHFKALNYAKKHGKLLTKEERRCQL